MFPSSVLLTALHGCTADIVGDIILIIIPLRLLWGLSVSRTRYRLLMAIFCASVFTTIVSVIHGCVSNLSRYSTIYTLFTHQTSGYCSVFVLGPSGLLEAITANVEVNIAILYSPARFLIKPSSRPQSPSL